MSVIDMQTLAVTTPLERFLARRAEDHRRPTVPAPTGPRAPCGLMLAAEIENICSLVSISRTRFGRDAVGDPRLYHDLKNCGRRPGRDVRIRILAHINHLAIEHSQRCKARAAMAQLAGAKP